MDSSQQDLLVVCAVGLGALAGAGCGALSVVGTGVLEGGVSVALFFLAIMGAVLGAAAGLLVGLACGLLAWAASFALDRPARPARRPR